MADMRFLEANDQRTKFRQIQPLRHLAPQHPALGFGRHQPGDVPPGGDAGPMDVVGPHGQCRERLGEHWPAAQLRQCVLLAVHPVAQGP